ncbi:acyl-CoA thioesterase [Ferdinandcohnia quinoae]|uniref:Acyl-CoA thioesterase n=1 Tax=Fredinandcohnia quinoae TaxID=2918902 RepID=A0AAW5E8Z5_9BACI|nr:thioesterase family protein [Fredinandcohnia sp. SECRCQ15]MCH1627959.1 acyl-CoA thioesterase [Fredinandcohnia sp. SECRCQ15]
MKQIAYINDIDTWKKSFTFYHPIKVRFSETDMFGHLNNTVPFVYFEEARIEFFNHLGFMQKWTKETSTNIPVVANQQCDYVKQVFFGEEIKLYVKIHEVGKSSLDIHYMAEGKDGSLCFTGRGTMVQVSTITGRGEQWSDEMKQIIAENTNRHCTQ